MLTQATRRASASAGAFRIVPVLDDLALARLLQLGARIHVAAEVAAIADDLPGRRTVSDFAVVI